MVIIKKLPKITYIFLDWTGSPNIAAAEIGLNKIKWDEYFSKKIGWFKG